MKRRKKNFQKKNIIYKIGIFSIFISIFLVSIGYSAFREDLSIENIVSYVEKIVNIKVSNVVVDSASDSDSYANSTSKTNTTFITNIHLNDSSSWVKYLITITNLGNEEMGIGDYLDNVLPSNLTYTVSGYTKGDMLCDDNNSSQCTLNSNTSFYITIKYKNGVTSSTPTDYDVNIGFDFQHYYTITYASGICSNCTSKVINGGSLNVNLSNYNIISVYMSNLLLTINDDYIFNTSSGALSISEVTGNVRIDNLSYTRIDYIESTGTTDRQYINTLYTPNINTSVIFDGMVVSGDTAIFGVRKASNGTEKFTVQYISSNTYRASFKSADYTLNTLYSVNTRYSFRMNSTNLYIDNISTSVFSAETELKAIGPIYLFAVNTNSSASNFGVTRLYSFKIYESDTLIKDFIPVLDSNDVPCLYDTIGETFYYNQGSGTFNYAEIVRYSITNNISYVTSSNSQTLITSGENYTTTFTPVTGRNLPKYLIITSNGSVLALNSDYTYNTTTGELTINAVSGNIVINEVVATELDYIISSGTQYINTGYVPTLNTKVVFTHIPLASTFSSWTAYFGTKNPSSNVDSFYASSGASKVSAYVGDLQVTNGNANYTHTIGSTQVITLSSSQLTIVEDGVTTLTRTNSGTQSFSNPASMYIFGRNSGGFNYGGSFKLKSFQIYENDVLQMDFVPVLDQTGIYCLYETIGEAYYYNQGTGSFSGGTD